MCNGSRMAYHLSPIAYLLILYPLPSACCSLRFTVYLYPICYILGSWPCYKVILKLIKCSFAYLLSLATSTVHARFAHARFMRFCLLA